MASLFTSTQFLNQLVNQAAEKIQAVPEHIRNTREEFQQELKTILSSLFAHLDLVTREEFDIQMKVLQETRSRIELLEKNYPPKADKHA